MSASTRRLLYVLVVPCALFLPTILAGEVFLPFLPAALEPYASEDPARAREAADGAHWVTGDRIFPFLTDQLAMGEELRRGDLPLWESRLGLGLPLYAGSIVGAAYPPNWLAFVLPPERAAAWLALVSLVLGGLGMGLFLTRAGFARGPTLVGVVAFQLGGWGIANLFYFMKVDAAIWIPWSLWAVEGIATGKRWSGTALAAAVTLSLLAGFVPIAVFGMVLTAAWAIVRFAPRFREAGGRRVATRGLAACALFLVLGGLGAAIQLLPTKETSELSPRKPTGAAELRGQTLPPAIALGTLVPDLFAAPTDPVPIGRLPVAWWLTSADDWQKAEQSSQLEWNTYAGAAVLLLALTALVARPRRALFPLLALVLAHAFAQGWPGVTWAYGVPGLNLGAPGRVLALAWILWPWLAALGAQALLERAPRAFGVFIGASFVLAAASFVFWMGLDPERWAGDLEQTLLARYGERFGQSVDDIRARVSPAAALAAGQHLQRALAHPAAAAGSAFLAGVLALLLGRSRSAGLPAWITAAASVGIVVLAAAPLADQGALGLSLVLALAAGAALAFLSGEAPRRGRGGWLPLVLVVLAEGLFAGSPRTRGRPGDIELFPPSPSIDAVREAAGDGRVMRFDTSASGVADLERLARPNMLAPYGVRDLTPFLVFTPRELYELFRSADERTLFRRHVARIPDAGLLDAPVLDLARVQAVLSTVPLAHPRLEPVLEREGFCVYHRKGALPFARVVPTAEVGASDGAVLEALTAGTVDLRRRTLIAPEHAGDVVPEAPLGDWRPGTLERIEDPARGRLGVRVEGSSGGWLVLHEQYAPGWRATVNGRDVPLVRADHAYRAVPIPRGDSIVETRYAPSSFRLGALVTAIALAAAITLGHGRQGVPRVHSKAPPAEDPVA